jgi:hypothetical protein
MVKGEQSGSSGRADWQVRLAGAVGGGVGAALGLLVVNLADMHGFGLIVFLAAFLGGLFLGRFAGSRLFQRPPGT